MTVPTVTLPLPDGSAAEMPMVGFGTWRMRGQQAYDATRAALDAGYRHIDTATMYGNEAEVGRALRDSGVPREDVFITTKLLAEDAGREKRALTDSLRHLGVQQVDLWLIHWPPGGLAAPEVWRELISAQDSGFVRSIGVSNYAPEQIDELVAATGRPPVVDQIPWSPARHDAPLLADLRSRNVVVEGYSLIKRTPMDSPVLAEIAGRHGRTPAQVVLRWHLQHDIVIIPKSVRADRIAENLDLFGFTLTDDEMHTLDRL
ncbi:diketogulonate reductase-like aldo/keto reductase [Catenuloplanes nepalensis]|uniref:Diketogulonate reductase-like aldo/keto reductase n=1 Tax=Catenuloplanes nepalensis TaxID=587533 RepID=A0ABT9MZ38_9ACTN|nr:aldo/keto reductase [Catenuloplanes nepalensis]MDP9796709.1 diketogulonate reductase-like aldo/keto reductase [Catenuloplanes nepalensis]